MRLARDTRQTLGLAIEALIELLDAVGPDPDAEPSLGNPEQMNQALAWDHPGNRQELEDEHNGCEPTEDELHHCDRENRVSVHAAHEQARTALTALVKRLRPGDINRTRAPLETS